MANNYLDQTDEYFINNSAQLVDEYWKYSKEESEKLIIKYISKALGEERQDWVFFWQSRRHFFNLNYLESLRLCTEAANTNPQNYYFARYCGVALNYLKRDKEALQWYEKAIALNPNDSINYTSKAISVHVMGETEEAIGLCDKAIKLDPSYSRNYRIKGYILNLARRYVEAGEYFSKALDLNPDNVDTLVNFAFCYEKMKDYEKALEFYEKARHITKNEKMKDYISDKIKNLEKLWFFNEFTEV